MTSTRQLAAIMFTDIVGYTALMGDNTEKALELVHISKGIQKPLVEKHDGKWLKEMGDGALVQFGSALDAVNCAIDIQEQARAKFDGKLRIGIHLGDITIENDDVYGDGVNVASRLESIADPGGIYMSDAILKAIQGQSNIQTKYLGEIPLKNVVYEVRTYAVQGAGLPVPVRKNNLSSDVTSPLQSTTKFPIWIVIGGLLVIIVLAFYAYPWIFKEFKNGDLEVSANANKGILDKSVAVLPFDDMSPKQDQEYFSDGMTEEILNHLYKIEDLRIPSRTTSMKYKETRLSTIEIAKEIGVTHIIQGSVRKSENRLRIAVQLIDAINDKTLWSETYDRDLAGVFAIQSEIAQQVALNLDAQIQPGTLIRIDKQPTNNLTAYDLYLKAMDIPAAEADFEVVQRFLNQAIQLDSNFARAYADLGNLTIFQAGFSGDRSPFEVGMKGKELLQKALLIDPLDGFAHNHLGNYYLWFEKDFNKAEIEYLTARSLIPSFSTNHYLDFLLASGRFDEAVPIGRQLIQTESIQVNWGFLALAQAFSDDVEGMHESIIRAKEQPISMQALIESARGLLIQKEYGKVLEILALSRDTQTIPRSIGLQAISYFKVGDFAKHNQLLTSLIKRSEESSGGSPSFYIAMIYGSIGDTDKAFKRLEKSYLNNEVELYWLKVEPEFEPLHDDPRWQEMLDKVGFPE